jgi:hypothetical protein
LNQGWKARVFRTGRTMEDQQQFQGHTAAFWWGAFFTCWLLVQLVRGMYSCGISEEGCTAAAEEQDWSELSREELTDEDLEDLRADWRGQWRGSRAKGDQDPQLQALSGDLVAESRTR